MGRKTNIAHKSDQDVFASTLKRLMENNHLTQKNLADMTGFQRQTIGQYVNGTSKPDTVRLTILAKSLGVSSDYLLGLAEHETPSEDMRAIINYTGLGIKSLEKLHSLGSSSSSVLLKAIDGFIAGLDSGTIEDLDERFGTLLKLSNYLDSPSAGVTDTPSLSIPECEPIGITPAEAYLIVWKMVKEEITSQMDTAIDMAFKAVKKEEHHEDT